MSRKEPSRRLKETAYHEAGHAVASKLMGLRVRSVTIQPRGEVAGECVGGSALRARHGPEYDASDRNRIRMERDVVALLAGNEAVRRLTGRSSHRGARHDREGAIDLLSYFADDVYEKPGRGKQEEFRTYFKLLRLRTRRLICIPKNWAQVEALALRLLEKTTLKGPEADEAMFEGYLLSLSPADRDGMRALQATLKRPASRKRPRGKN